MDTAEVPDANPYAPEVADERLAALEWSDLDGTMLTLDRSLMTATRSEALRT